MHSKNIRKILYLVAKYFFGAYALDAAPKIARNESLMAAILWLKKKYKIFQPAPVRFLIHFYRYLLDENFYLPQDTNNTFIIHFCCWGKSYSEKAKSYLLPSLLSDDNLPEIAKKYKTILLIQCDLETKNTLDTSSVITQVKKYADVKIILLSKALMKSYNANFKYPNFWIFKKIKNINAHIKYFFLGGLQAQALEMALKNKSYISFLMPDLVLSDSFFKKSVFNHRK